MNQAELILNVAQLTGESKKTVEHVLKSAADIITSGLAEGSEIALMGLGKLKVTTRAARTGRNPATGESIEIPAKNAVKFSIAKALGDALNPATKKKVKK